ncbi:DUF6270 domain-containing protein [Bacillus sp. FJAT-25509]|uniref:DUF6270 domain-containing protein n=1 Tax=Bacillus sp. FJAT-25509 TaxID=1712029 RepID=UPI0006F9EA24|nr:DUF6270 domain-containing protein [Bacillus sp. FJAT-25509]
MLKKIEYLNDGIRLCIEDLNEKINEASSLVVKQRSNKHVKVSNEILQCLIKKIDNQYIVHINFSDLKNITLYPIEIFDLYLAKDAELLPLEISRNLEMPAKYMSTKLLNIYYVKTYITNDNRIALYLTQDKLHFNLVKADCFEDFVQLSISDQKQYNQIKTELAINTHSYSARSGNNNEILCSTFNVFDLLNSYPESTELELYAQITLNKNIKVLINLLTENESNHQTKHFSLLLNKNVISINSNEKKLKVAAFGSCVTRDNFNSKFNLNYKNHFELIRYQNQSSIISLMGNPIPYNREKIDNLNQYEQNDVFDDLEKNFLNDLINKQPEALILDFFGDVYFGCLKTNSSYFTNNRWKITKTSFYRELNEVTTFNLNTNLSEYFTLWKQSIDKFLQIINREIPNCKIILHKARFTGMYYDQEQNIKKINSDTDIELLNAFWDQLDEYVISNYEVSTINVKQNYISIADHAWGIFHLHFEPNYYKNFLAQLIKLTK